ncbi:glutamyl-tRNA amidotransferase [Zalerion maritima]|uniref:Glutamyl-tRNA amidotransferase n=1 Tax=Zalerion maritima TaxID=339359 RepID=A0AAD5RPP8_9PEZI|nr:glutamyl-tRNA amidotransferase [Zalerion maritima]
MVGLFRALSLTACLGAARSQLVSTGASVSLDGIYYYISPYSEGKISGGFLSGLDSIPSAFGFKPITIVAESVGVDALTSLFTNWTAADDVFQPAFMQGLFLTSLDQDDYGKVDTFTTSGVGSRMLPLGDCDIPSGPYFMSTATGDVYRAFRLYDDFSGSFTESLLQKPDGSFQALSAQMPTSVTLTIGVPSRLYFTPTEEKPLAGVRVAVKDIYALAGTKQSNGNRAWYDFYPAANETGPAMQSLVDAGAIIVGKQVPSQFANGESATADWVDYHSPLNPRGDGYNQPSSSSSDAGASMGTYEWLDISVGSDTGGSIRGPAGEQGIFGNRPSHGLVSLDDVMPLSPTLDTAGFLTRDPYLWDVANKVLYGDNYTSLAESTPSYPTTIYTVGDYFNTTDGPAQDFLDDFASALASLAGGSIEEVDIEEAWNETSPSAAGGATMLEMLNTTYVALITKEQIELVRDPFYADYAAAYDGRLPFVDPSPLARWAFGDTLPESALEEAKTNKTIFMDWFSANYLSPVDDPLQCSSSILAYAGRVGESSPRNLYFDAPSPPFGWYVTRISIYTEAPDHVLPLGEVEYSSTITNYTELLPVTVNVMAAKGCDGMLVKLAQDLVAEGSVVVPEVGRTLGGGDVLMKRGFTAERF